MFDGALLIRRQMNGPFDGGEDVVNVLSDEDIGEGRRRFSRVLGDEDCRFARAGCLTPKCRMPGWPCPPATW